MQKASLRLTNVRSKSSECVEIHQKSPKGSLQSSHCVTMLNSWLHLLYNIYDDLAIGYLGFLDKATFTDVDVALLHFLQKEIRIWITLNCYQQQKLPSS